MSPTVWIFCRAFVQVALVAANTKFVAAGAGPAAFLTGFSISWLWWANSRSAALAEGRAARWAYALGAACGTVAGMSVAAGLASVLTVFSSPSR